MPYGKVAFVIRLSPRQPGYTMTTCAHERNGRAKRHIAVRRFLKAIIDADGDILSLGLIGVVFLKRVCNGNFPIGTAVGSAVR
jgi:hypothetical protein